VPQSGTLIIHESHEPGWLYRLPQRYSTGNVISHHGLIDLHAARCKEMTLRRTINIGDKTAGLITFPRGPSKLYLDDIELIYQTLINAAEERGKNSESGQVAPVAIYAGEAVADSPEDLREARPEELKRVRIALNDPVVTVDLWRPSLADVSAVGSDSDGSALAVGIRDFVNQRRSLRHGFRWFTGRSDVDIFLGTLLLASGIWAR
jgi:hypothetical protein